MLPSPAPANYRHLNRSSCAGCLRATSRRAIWLGMADDPRWRDRRNNGPVIDVTPDGQFVDPARPQSALPAKLFGVAVLVAVLAGATVIALLALWLALQLIPIAIGAALIAYGVFRFQVWRARRGGGSLFGGQRNVFRP
jgi:hypothetical protein